MELRDSIQAVKNVGPERQRQLNRLGIYTVEDLLEYFPGDYEDRSRLVSFKELSLGMTNSFRATICSTPQVMRFKNVTVTRVQLTDGVDYIDGVWFNQPYLKNSLAVGDEYFFTGKINEKYGKIQIEAPEMEKIHSDGKNVSAGRIVPVYSLTKSVNQRLLRTLINDTVCNVTQQFLDFMPVDIKKEYRLCDRAFAIRNIHFPQDSESFFVARKRLVFEELFLLQLKLLQLKGTIKRKECSVKIESLDIMPVLEKLGFELTLAQKKVLKEIFSDFKSGLVMNRLVQGDVGCGKTAIAILCAYVLIKNGYQVVLMAPTDVLATQHFNDIAPLFEQLGIECALLTGGLRKKQKDTYYEGIKSGTIKMIIGTHAVIQERVEYNKLGLVITDEQHRFGVGQRSVLEQKGKNPHVLVMTATPIPRTLGLILYGDLDISIIDSLPPGRQRVDTFAVGSSHYEKLYVFIDKQIETGRQAYIICPMIDEDDKQELKSAVAYSESLKQIFPKRVVECLHGKMKPGEKQEIMDRFVQGQIDVLVSTTVIEVGVNVPNATIMLIENAERFGLATLHQLRGRVGRGKEKSYCVLVSDSKNKLSKERLGIMCKSSSGFEIAEKDLELRGPGDFFGTKQHGLPEMKIANLYKDIEILKLVQGACLKLCREDFYLENGENANLREKLLDIFDKNNKNLSL